MEMYLALSNLFPRIIKRLSQFASGFWEFSRCPIFLTTFAPLHPRRSMPTERPFPPLYFGVGLAL